MTLADRLGVAVARNQPYAGGHVVRTHGRPDQGVEAVQIEIDRDLYLAPDRMPDAAKGDRLSRWFSGLVADVARAEPLPVAAEKCRIKNHLVPEYKVARGQGGQTRETRRTTWRE